MMALIEERCATVLERSRSGRGAPCTLKHMRMCDVSGRLQVQKLRSINESDHLFTLSATCRWHESPLSPRPVHG
jgi:hypothetical protein